LKTKAKNPGSLRAEPSRAGKEETKNDEKREKIWYNQSKP